MVARTTIRVQDDVVVLQLGWFPTLLSFRHRIEVPQHEISRIVAVERGSLESH